MYAGTTEVIARALHDNGLGVIHTVDPFGADRAPAVIASWPQPLRAITHFHAVNSMFFFARSADIGRRFDIVLVDGNHDFEFALFDIQMAARLTTPSGLILVDNAEQSGPFVAAQRFVRANPGWSLLGACPDPDRPFAPEGRASLPETSLMVLQAPPDTIIGEEPVSWGQALIGSPLIDGIRIQPRDGNDGGTLHYKAILRAFGDAARRIEEFTTVGKVAIEGGAAAELSHKLEAPLRSEFPLLFPDSHHTFEIELAWRSKAGRPLRLKNPPLPLAGDALAPLTFPGRFADGPSTTE
jgi:hypothetical protein